MGNLMKKLKKTKMVKQFGILSLVLAMLIGVMSNGTIGNAVDGNADANITFNSRIVEKVNGQDVDVSQADSGGSFFLAMYTMYLYRMFLLYSESPLIQGVYALNVYAMFMMFFNNHFLQLSYPITIVLIAWAINRFNRRRLQQENKEK